MRYNFTISHIPGKELVVADTLSRAPSRKPADADEELQEEADAFVSIVVNSLPATEKRLDEIRQHQARDLLCQQLMIYYQSEWPRKKSLPPEIKPYHAVASELSLLVRATGRIVVPAALQKQVLSQIHCRHKGIHKCCERARDSVWWPGLSTQLEQMANRCPECHRAWIQRRLILSKLPDLPWEKVGMDLFEWKKSNYLLVVDYYSRYIEIARLNRSTAEEVITHTKSIFARHGIPEVVMSNNGPQFSPGAFKQFSEKYQFEHVTMQQPVLPSVQRGS